MVGMGAVPIVKNRNLPRFFYITGCDGTGKSTQANLLVEALRARGIQPIHLWLRFPFFFSAPFLLYARWRKYSWSEEQQGVKHGYWHFQTSWLMRAIFPWVYLLDAAFASLWKVYLPLPFGRTIVCERFAIDMLADLEMGLGDPDFHRRAPGRFFYRLVPASARVVLLDLDEETAKSRRPDLLTDHLLGRRLQTFRDLAADYGLQVENSQRPVDDIQAHILHLVDTRFEGAYGNIREG